MYSINELWTCEDEEKWKEALERYDENVKKKNMWELEQVMRQVNAEEFREKSAKEVYEFLKDEFFPWEFKDRRVLSLCRNWLSIYDEKNEMDQLAEIRNKMFEIKHTDIEECLEKVMEIRGLGISGGSGLLAVLFPEDFGEINDKVFKLLSSIEGIPHGMELSQIQSKDLDLEKAVILTKMLREKAEELNTRFGTNFWTPRKIDMVLWAYEN